MPASGNQDGATREYNRSDDKCPICGLGYTGAREVYERERRDGEIEEMPGILYEHTTSDCVEWADHADGRPIRPASDRRHSSA